MARRRATTWGQPCQSNHWAGMQRVGVVAGRNTKRATWMPTRRRVLTAVGRSNLAHGNIGKFSERFCRRPTRLRLALNAVDVDGRATPWTARPMPPRTRCPAICCRMGEDRCLTYKCRSTARCAAPRSFTSRVTATHISTAALTTGRSSCHRMDGCAPHTTSESISNPVIEHRF